MNYSTLSHRFEKIETKMDEIRSMLQELLKRETLPSPPTAIDESEIMSVKQLTKLMGIDQNIIYAKCAKGDMPYFKIGKQYRFKKIEIMKWIKEQKEESDFSVDNYVERYMQKNLLKG